MLIKYAFFWVGAVILAIVNGTLREKVYGPRLSELAAHQLASVIAIVLFGLYLLVLNLFWPLESAHQAVEIGVLWLLLTVIFEFVFGRYVMGHSWRRLFNDYNLAAGRLWLLVLAWVAAAPWVVYRVAP